MSEREGLKLTGLFEQARDFSSALHANAGLLTESKSVGVGKPRCKPKFWSGRQNRLRGRRQFRVGSLLFTSEVRTAQTLLTMPPRGHASPCRGKKQGQRGNPGGRGATSPRRVSPLAYAPPSSPGSDDSDSDISNSVQTVKFKYYRRTNKPIVSKLITVIFKEEDGEEGSGKRISEEQETSTNNSSLRGGKEESSYLPSSQNKSEKDSTGVQSEERTEALRDICSLMDMEITSSVQHQVTDPQAKKTPEEEKKPARFFGSRLYPILPPGIQRLEDIPAGMEVICVPDPEREAAEWAAEQQAKEQKETENQAEGKVGKD